MIECMQKEGRNRANVVDMVGLQMFSSAAEYFEREGKELQTEIESLTTQC